MSVGQILIAKTLELHTNQPFEFIEQNFRKIVAQKIMKFCESNNLLHGAQFGFWPKMSCVHTITTVTEHIRAATERSSQVNLVLLICKNPSIHSIMKYLLQKMENDGSRGKILSLIASFWRLFKTGVNLFITMGEQHQKD